MKILTNRRIATWFCCILAFVFNAGCGPNVKQAGPLNPNVAKDALKKTLDAWQNGKSIEELEKGSPSIVAQDVDWIKGAKLARYEILADGSKDEANLRCPVKLILKDPMGQEVPKNVTYIISTDPKVTVFREVM